MELSNGQKEELNKLMAETKCKKDFECHKSNFKNCCEGELIGNNFVRCERDSLKCSVEKFESCDFSVSFGYGFLCNCPLRIYAAQNLKH